MFQFVLGTSKATDDVPATPARKINNKVEKILTERKKSKFNEESELHCRMREGYGDTIEDKVCFCNMGSNSLKFNNHGILTHNFS